MVFLGKSRLLGLHMRKGPLRQIAKTFSSQTSWGCMNTRIFHSSYLNPINPNPLVAKSRLLRAIPSSGSRLFFSSTPLARRSKLRDSRPGEPNQRIQREQHARNKHQRQQKQHTQDDDQYIDPIPLPRSRERSSYPLAVLIAVGCTYITLSYNRSPFVEFPLPNLVPKLTPSYLEKNFILSQQNIDEGRIHTLLTNSFMHITYPHLFMNMLGLLFLAPLVNPLTFVAVWAGAGVTCSFASLYTWKHGLRFHRGNGLLERINRGCGASGSLFGLFAMTAVKFPSLRWQVMFIPIGIPGWLFLGGETIYSILALQNGWQPQVGHAGHLGGTAFGVLAGILSGRFGLKMRGF
ncbi:8c50c752-9585-4c05-886d-a4b5558aa74c [Sclerotinia trifoliorum]|uniref:8c50c752-9585-4c05-886d-a4b5558aa74c n=1 Tax=Sclerotinia trifoliorum TaxID=28548 RepID=A0A8H2ZMX7_9HELO|nr:8c50c752-9585-4c05-886d-a4b5558aa74c [Sclerotinia trifoliorum]